MSAEELRLELDELRHLEGLAKRPRVQSLLANEIRNVEAKVASSPFFSSSSIHFLLHIFSVYPPIPFGASVDSDSILSVLNLRCLIVMCDGSWRRQLHQRPSRRRRLRLHVLV
jgi:hypothetical protein